MLNVLGSGYFISCVWKLKYAVSTVAISKFVTLGSKINGVSERREAISADLLRCDVTCSEALWVVFHNDGE